MATKIQWRELMSPMDAMDAEVKRNTGVSIRENIAKMRARNPMAKERFFIGTAEGQLPFKNLKRVQ